ncbi:MAG: prepilin-type cleavage/methylation domain-containing protein [Psychrobium sp.]|nr:prepilin-type cleavage/methylation domain-containing protein [Psychrobium sp.]
MVCKTNNRKFSVGFSLIELVIGMLVFSIAMTMMLSLIYPQVERSLIPIYQIRATKLANSLLNEIRGKAFDENSNLTLAGNRCGEGTAPLPCTAPGDLGAVADGESRDQFDDVDDFHGFDIEGTLLTQSDQFKDLYVGFSLKVEVFYDGNYDGQKDASSDPARNAKLIKISVTMPNDETLSFAAYRSNY